MDAANVDLKGFTDDFYLKLTGAHLQPVLDTLIISSTKPTSGSRSPPCSSPARTTRTRKSPPLSQLDLQGTGADVPLHFSAFHPDYKMTDMPATPPATLTRARHIALKEGLHYVYTGNVHDPEGDTTYCPSCHKPLIVRDWYQINATA